MTLWFTIDTLLAYFVGYVLTVLGEEAKIANNTKPKRKYRIINGIVAVLYSYFVCFLAFYAH